jgi:hypothetical protein
MIERQEDMERTNSPTFCRRSANKGSSSTDMYGCIFYSFSVWCSFCNAFSYETARGPPRTTWRTAADHRWPMDRRLRNISLELYRHQEAKPFKGKCTRMEKCFVSGGKVNTWSNSVFFSICTKWMMIKVIPQALLSNTDIFTYVS